jgi:RHS repeat-associated protein
VWSYPNIHGDIIATTNGSGIKAGATRGYDPFGNLLGTSTTPDNSAGPFDYGWHGSAQRPVEYSSGFTPLIEMGARQYSSLLGRFLETDPILGGNANDYAYVSDPVGMSDLDGLCGVWGNPRRRCHSNHRGASSFGNWVGHGIRRWRNYAGPRASCLTARGYCSARFNSENRTMARLGNEVRSSISVTGCVYACASVNGWGKLRFSGLTVGPGAGSKLKPGLGASVMVAVPGSGSGPTATPCYVVCISSGWPLSVRGFGLGTPGLSVSP